MYHRQQNKCYPNGVRLSEKLQQFVMKFDRSNKCDLCYYGQVNSLRLKPSVAWKWISTLSPLGVTFILLAMVLLWICYLGQLKACHMNSFTFNCLLCCLNSWFRLNRNICNKWLLFIWRNIEVFVRKVKTRAQTKNIVAIFRFNQKIIFRQN